jgi:hypothetical protein
MSERRRTSVELQKPDELGPSPALGCPTGGGARTWQSVGRTNVLASLASGDVWAEDGSEVREMSAGEV